VRIAGAAEVRASIAAHLSGSATREEQLGEVTLHAHQRVAVERLVSMLENHRGALLADDVGLGKTFVALAVARREPSALVIAPAALRRTWDAAAHRAGVAVGFASIESLARGRKCEPAALVIIDEAHHVRSPSTKRYAALRELCASAKVLLLSATPVQNSFEDLRTILALSLGERARAASAEELAEFVVRRVAGDVEQHERLHLPAVAEPVWIQPPPDVDCLERLMALPAPLPPSDGADGGVLLTYSLVRQWTSSRAALRGALTRRLARAHALDDALAAGRWPSRRELAAWQFADGAQQLTFPELIASANETSAPALREQVLRHADGVRELSAWLSAARDPDASRADLLLEVARRHSGERIIVFSEYTDTVAAMFRALLHRARVAMLTHGGGRVAGGHVSRDSLLAHFASDGSGSSESDRVDMLVTTDVLSEGVDLQRASVVVHLDLAWNPARLEQRVGRLRRIGAARDRVVVYAFAPPAPAERMLRLEQRLRVKLGVAASSLGLAGAILPGLLTPERPSPVARAERIQRLVRAWRGGAASQHPIAASVRSKTNAALACVRRDGHAELIAVIDGKVSDSSEDVERLVLAANGPDAPTEPRHLAEISCVVETWLARRANAGVIDLPFAHIARARHHVLRRAQAIAHRVHRHERVGMRDMLGAARSVATATLSAGAERVLDELARADMSDVAWLQSLGQFAAIHARAASAEPDAVLALLLLRADR
jgi:superfamily II DNA or RNA helicase